MSFFRMRVIWAYFQGVIKWTVRMHEFFRIMIGIWSGPVEFLLLSEVVTYLLRGRLRLKWGNRLELSGQAEGSGSVWRNNGRL